MGFVCCHDGDTKNLQGRHEHGKPEFLGAQEGIGIQSPLVQRDIICVAQYNKCPCCLG